MKKSLLSLIALFLLTSCVVPDTQPVIEGILEWKKAEDQELNRHRQLANVAKFDSDPVKNAESKASYISAIEMHSRIADGYANALINWAQRVGKFDSNYANLTLDQMLDYYIKIRTVVKVNK